MRTMFTIPILLMSIAVCAQQKAAIEVSYDFSVKSLNGNTKTTNYHLLANPQQSKFFSPKSEQIDSMLSTPEGEAKFNEMQEAALKSMMAQGAINVKKLPRKTESIYIIKNSIDSMLTYYDMIGRDEYITYPESFEELKWTLGDESKTILSYDCIQAIADYHGRNWIAWFTTDIPINDGPWKFHGLPGLILEVSDTSGSYSFLATELEKSDKPIVPVYGSNKYDKIERRSFLRAKRAILDNPLGALSAKGIKIQINPNDIPESDRDKWDFTETDY